MAQCINGGERFVVKANAQEWVGGAMAHIRSDTKFCIAVTGDSAKAIFEAAQEAESKLDGLATAFLPAKMVPKLATALGGPGGAVAGKLAELSFPMVGALAAAVGTVGVSVAPVGHVLLAAFQDGYRVAAAFTGGPGPGGGGDPELHIELSK